MKRDVMTPEIDQYFMDGCGRCKLYQTAQCKVHHWKKELLEFRSIALESGLQEQIKWGQLTYTNQNKNILIVASFKEYVAMTFIKGALLLDEDQLLMQPTANTTNARQIRIKNVQEIINKRKSILHLIQQAVELEKQGVKVITKKVEDFPFPDELLSKFDENPIFKSAFQNLTPGRQKAYLLYFNQAKQVKTRVQRIEKHLPKILIGKGLND